MTAEESLKEDRTAMRMTRLNLNLSEQVRADLDHLSERTGCSLTELVRFGLRMARVCYELDNTQRLAVVDKEDKFVREIVPPWGSRL